MLPDPRLHKIYKRSKIIKSQKDILIVYGYVYLLKAQANERGGIMSQLSKSLMSLVWIFFRA